MQPRIVDISTQEGDTVAVYQWPAPEQRTKGVVIISHCFSEYHLRHLVVALWWFRKGYQVFGYDSYGHNRSSGRQGDLPSKDRNITDMCAVIDYCNTACERLRVPLYIYAVGTGALSAGKIGFNQLRRLDALILVAPAFQLILNRTQSLLAKYITHLPMKHLRFDADMRGEKLAKLPHTAAAFDSDPLIVRKMSVRYYLSIEQESAYLRSKAAEWSLPTFIVSAGEDRICSSEAIKIFCDIAPLHSVTHCHIPSAYHHLHDDPARETFFHQLTRWLSQLRGESQAPATTHSMRLY